jgi:RNA polymerase sigma factor (sigma-70 family)
VRTLRRRTIDVSSRQALAGYLREAVRNRVHDEHRRLGRRGLHEGLPDTLAGPQPSPFDEALASEIDARYRSALTRLGPRDRELIVAHVELGYSHEQLGFMIGRSRNAARMALDRAVRRLADAMGDV